MVNVDIHSGYLGIQSWCLDVLLVHLIIYDHMWLLDGDGDGGNGAVVVIFVFLVIVVVVKVMGVVVVVELLM